MAQNSDNSCHELKYFMNEEKSDIVFLVEGQRVPAIKFLLSLKSPVFEVMFSGAYKESKESEIPIEDTDYETFKAFVRFIYCEQLVAKELTDPSLANKVFNLCHKYQAQTLMDCIERKLTELIDKENIEDIYEFAASYELKALIESLNAFIDRNFEDFAYLSIDAQKRLNTLSNSHYMELFISRKFIPLKEEYETLKSLFGRQPGRMTERVGPMVIKRLNNIYKKVDNKSCYGSEFDVYYDE